MKILAEAGPQHMLLYPLDDDLEQLEMSARAMVPHWRGATAP